MDERKCAQLLKRQQQRGSRMKKDISNLHSCSCGQRACLCSSSVCLCPFISISYHTMREKEAPGRAASFLQGHQDPFFDGHTSLYSYTYPSTDERNTFIHKQKRQTLTDTTPHIEINTCRQTCAHTQMDGTADHFFLYSRTCMIGISGHLNLVTLELLHGFIQSWKVKAHAPERSETPVETDVFLATGKLAIAQGPHSTGGNQSFMVTPL